MKISRTVSYALQATLQLVGCEDGTPVSCSQLAADGKMPERFLLQVMRKLVAHGILESTRGAEGGYSLGRSPEAISLLEVLEAIDGPFVPVLPVSNALPANCKLKLEQTLSDVTDGIRRELAAINVAHLMAEPDEPASAARSPGPRSHQPPKPAH